ncbi:trypsin-like serine peptidase [Tundrisphaera sp. TA3]|uniref:trypsin-like serine peptidase n=1 Tax=Tundrisphaera sp. TA3 TaxID=3435775 RepID=UPI003EBD58BE
MNGRFLARPGGRVPASLAKFHSTWAVETAADQLELILDESGALLPFHFLRTGDQRGRAVVKLLRGDGGAGTGFLVAPGILLTNHHVLPDAASAATATVHGNYEAAPPGPSLGRPTSVPLDPEALFVTNSDLDFTFCGVRGLDALGTIRLDRNSQNISTNETVNIIQHPRGRPKEVALRDNRVIKADGVVLHYACSTEPGSSGSPVFNNAWEAVAMHHASVVAHHPEGRRAEGLMDDGVTRYLNEGIRISAIALWLETVEAEQSLGPEGAARLRAIFGGIDPQVGFFGALGRKSHGNEAPEVIAESYRRETDDIDLAFWNTRGLEATFRERISDIGRVVADMGLDVWCLAHADVVSVAALREHLDSHYQLDYEFLHEPAGPHPSLILLYRRSKALVVERKPWDLEGLATEGLPPLISLRVITPRLGAVAFHLVPVVRVVGDQSVDAYAEAIRRSTRHAPIEADWIVVGETGVLFEPGRLQVLADCGGDLLAAASDRDGSLALLAGPRSQVRRVFASANLRPAFGNSDALAFPGDREMPARLRTLGGHLPIAFRLSLDEDPRPKPPADPGPALVEPPPPQRPEDDELERRIRDILSPLLARLMSEMRSAT